VKKYAETATMNEILKMKKIFGIFIYLFTVSTQDLSFNDFLIFITIN